MTKEQIALIRDYALKDDGTGNPLTFSLAAIFNNEIAYINTDHFVIWDDAHALVHCILPNVDSPVSQSIAPYKISTGFYDNIQYMEGLYDMKNFKTFVKEQFLDKGLIDAEQQSMIMNWAESIRNHIDIGDSNIPYFKNIASIPPKSAEGTAVRTDGIRNASAIDRYTAKDELYQIIADGFAKAASTKFISMVTNNVYKVKITNVDGMVNDLYTIISSIPNLKFASFYNNNSFARVESSADEANFKISAKLIVEHCLDMYPASLSIASGDVRVDYLFHIVEDDGSIEPVDFRNYIDESVANYVTTFSNPDVFSIEKVDDEINVVLTSGIKAPIGLVAFLSTLDNVDLIKFTYYRGSYVATVSNDITLRTLENSIIHQLPTSNDASEKSFRIALVANNKAATEVGFVINITYDDTKEPVTPPVVE